jgi:hypothetical protein
MALGKEIGSFELNITSWSHGEDGASVAITVDGPATDFGTVLGTLFGGVEPGAKSGPCSWRSQAFLDNGDIAGGSGEGTWMESGKHQWRIRMTIAISDGRFIASDGTLDLAGRSFNGKILEWS